MFTLGATQQAMSLTTESQRRVNPLSSAKIQRVSARRDLVAKNSAQTCAQILEGAPIKQTILLALLISKPWLVEKCWAEPEPLACRILVVILLVQMIGHVGASRAEGSAPRHLDPVLRCSKMTNGVFDVSSKIISFVVLEVSFLGICL